MLVGILSHMTTNDVVLYFGTRLSDYDVGFSSEVWVLVGGFHHEDALSVAFIKTCARSDLISAVEVIGSL